MGNLKIICVLDLSANNFLPIFKIIHSSDDKTIEFSCHDVVIRDLNYTSIVIASRCVDDFSSL